MKEYKDQTSEVNEPDLTGTYSATEYLSWKTDELMELIRGKIFKMTPTPVWRHQEILGEFYLLFRKFVKKPCRVGLSPIDVFLFHPGEDWKMTKNIFQPDLCIICDPKKIQRRGCIGAPDLVVEVLSPGTAKKDLGLKRDIYQEYGVKELWIVHPNDETVVVHVLENAKYKILPIVAKGQFVQSPTFHDLQFDLDLVFPEQDL